MNLLRCHVMGFGRLADRALEFRDGLNLLFAPNEAGKSTLQRFLIALLYGQLRPDLKTQRRLESWVDAYKPWGGAGYGGALWCRLASGREIEIHRTFGKEDARTEIRTASGEDITGEYEQQRNGDVLFARTHFGLPKELFESVAVIRENKAAELDGHETIRDRIANLALSGDEDLSVQQSLQKLEAALDGIGSDRAPTRPYRQAFDRLQSLREEMRALETRRKEYEAWLAERCRLAGEVVRLEGEVKTSQLAVVAAHWRETSEKVRVIADIDREIRDLHRELQIAEGRVDFPAQYREELDELIGASETIGKRLKDARKDLKAASEQLAVARSARETLACYEPLITAGEADKITGWFVGYLRLSTHRDEAQRSIARYREELRATQEPLARLGAAFTDPSVDWQARAMEAAEEERKGAAESLLLTESISQQKTALAGVQSRTTRYRLLGIALLATVLFPLGGWLLLGPETIPSLAALAASTLLGFASAQMLRAASKSRRKADETEQALAALESERDRVREESQLLQREISQSMKNAAFTTLEDFLAAAKRAENWRQKATDLDGRIREAEQQRDALAAECTELYSHLLDLLGRAGLSCSPGTVKIQVDVFRENLKKFRDLDETYRTATRQVESLTTREADLAAEAAEKSTRIQAILEEARVESHEAFRQACEKRRGLLELMARESTRTRELERICGNLSFEKWQEKLQELGQILAGTPADPAGVPAPPVPALAGARLPYLPYLPTVGDAELEEKRAAACLAAAREEHARVIERVKQAFHHYRELSEIEEDLAEAEATLHSLERNRKSLDLALQTILTLSREQQEVLAPQLNSAVEQRFLRLCQGRYREVKIDPDLNVWVRASEAGELRNAVSLSRGTQDQLYLAIRFGILDLVAGSEEPCPSLLDEPFAAYDRERMVEAFRILKEETARRQLILFTCREDLREMARDNGAHILQLTNEG